MKNSWHDKEAKACGNDDLKLRVYTSRLLGKEPSLVLHGGGNTSVKSIVKDFFGISQEILYIKGSGWDLATIEPQGFAGVRLDVLKQMATFKTLTDTDMVREQRAAMLDPNAPAPSVEAILHAIIPYKFVDHSHADVVAAITNTPHGAKYIKEIYGEEILIVPYVMPGFVLARKVYEMTRAINWKKCQGIVLLNHGLFTFGSDAKTSYDNHIRLVTKAEKFIKDKKINVAAGTANNRPNLLGLSQLRQAVSKAWGGAAIAYLNSDAPSIGFSNLPKVQSIATRGTLTPDHVIRTKPIPVIVGKDPVLDVQKYSQEYLGYFKKHTNGKLKCLDTAPRWAVWPGQGLISFGRSMKDAKIVSDIIDHTAPAIQLAEKLGGWKVLSQKDIFEMEYWELEQAKLSKNPKPLPLQGKIALVTGAASGIGKACIDSLVSQGAHVTALDIQPAIANLIGSQVVGVVCDVTKDSELQKAVELTVRRFGGLDIIVSNAGIFPPSETLTQMNPNTWDKSMQINLTSHQRLMTAALPYLKLGIDPTFIIIGSKNVPAPGPGAGAYSVAKAGLTQLARVAALELAPHGIRVNVLHPNQVFDTAIWTKDVLEKRAKHYGVSIDEYKKSNLLKTEITSKHVADLVCTLAGPIFAKTTGAQIPIDGGNDRVI